MTNGGYGLNGKTVMHTMSVSLTITNNMKKQKPIHPGEILLEDFLIPFKLTQYRLAKDISVPARRINEIVHGVRAISPDTALRLAKYFKTSPEFWLNLQSHYDLEAIKETWTKTVEKQVLVFQMA